MQLVREHINEKFTQDSDPIHDMNIGVKHLIEKWLNDLKNNYFITNSNIIINNDGTIDANGNVDISYEFLDILPPYIKFNKIYGSFACCLTREGIKNVGPKYVEHNYTVYVPTIRHKKNVPTETLIRKYCIVGLNVYIKQIR